MLSPIAMKYVVILGDGMSDYPVERLGGKTPLQAARKPNIDRLAREGTCGLLRTLEDDVPTGSEAANLAVLGYDPRTVLQGRGVLEAASMGVDIGPDEIGMRCNLICLADGKIKNHSAGHISSEESDEILKTVQTELGSDSLHFYTGVSYRHLFVGRGLDPRLECTPPHDHPGKEAEPLLIRPKVPEAQATAALLNRITRQSWALLKDHPVNRRRIAAGKDPGNSLWLWSPGRRPKMWTFPERFGVHGSVISAVDLIRGIGVYAGLQIVRVPGATGLWNTDYEGKADACLKALETSDFCYVHLEGARRGGPRRQSGSQNQDYRRLGRAPGRTDSPRTGGPRRNGRGRRAARPSHTRRVARSRSGRGALRDPRSPAATGRRCRVR